MLVREARVEDIDQLLNIEEYCYDTPWPREAFEEEVGNGDRGMGFVVEDEGLIVGFLTGMAVGRDLHLHNIAVHPDHQNQGVGRELMEAADAYCREREFQSITLEVRTDNAIARRLYLGMGFSAVGTLKDHYGPGQDAHLYTKKLNID